jgi:hypothetical protein
VPGNPETVVQNMPGAGGVVAANYIYAVARPDGLTLGAFNPGLYFEQLVGRPEVKFDWSKFTWIGSPEQNDVMHYIRSDAPFKTVDDLRNAKEPPRCGSTGTGTSGHYLPHLLDETLGIKTTIVSGYQVAPRSIWRWKETKSFAGHRWSPLSSAVNLTRDGSRRALFGSLFRLEQNATRG